MDTSLTDAAGRALDPLAESAERAEFRRQLRRLIEQESPPERVRELDEEARFDQPLHRKLAQMGVLALGAPENLGGAGDVRDQVAAVEELAAGPTSMAAFVILQFMAIQVLRQEEDSEALRVLRELIAGDCKVSFAMSEPGGGTDVARAMKTRAEAVPGGYRIRGQKLWITAASLADWVLLLARSADYESSPVDGVTLFLLPAGADGLRVRDIGTFGLHSVPTCEVFLDDVFAPSEAVLGEPGRGFRQVFGTLNRERLNSAAAALGVARAAHAYSVDYAGQRQAFGRPIGAFQSLQHRLAEGAVALENARSLVVRAAEIEAGGGRADVLATMAKLVASDAASRVTQDGMQILAGAGFSREYPMQRWFRDVRLWNFAPVSDEMARNYLGERLLGLPRSY